MEALVCLLVKKECLALIGDPAEHVENYINGEVGGMANFTALAGTHEVYPITYNRYGHYGNFSTWHVSNNNTVPTVGYTETIIDQAAEKAILDATVGAEADKYAYSK